MAVQGPIVSIEDDEDDQYLIAQAIKQVGVTNELRFFNDGHQALNYLQTTAEKPFLILCDVKLSVMDGLTFRQRIQEDDYLRRKAIPFVFFTTQASAEDVEKAYELTVQGFYEKAALYNELVEQIRLITQYWKSCLHPNRMG